MSPRRVLWQRKIDEGKGLPWNEGWILGEEQVENGYLMFNLANAEYGVGSWYSSKDVRLLCRRELPGDSSC